MLSLVSIVHYGAATITIAFPVVGTALGQAISSRATLDALNVQPAARGSMGKILMVALALIETAALFSTLMCFFILRDGSASMAQSLSQLGAALAIALPACTVGFVSSYVVRRAFVAASRQPLFAQRITYLLFLTLSIAQTPTIFGLMIGIFLLKGGATEALSLMDGVKFLASGMALGIGSIGPALGVAFFGGSACEGVGINRDAYGRIFSFALMSLAIIETPVLFALVISILLYLRSVPADALSGVLCISSALAIGFCTLGLGISSGKTASSACLQIARNVDHYSVISRTSITAQTLIDTNVIYGFLVSAGFIIFFF